MGDSGVLDALDVVDSQEQTIVIHVYGCRISRFLASVIDLRVYCVDVLAVIFHCFVQTEFVFVSAILHTTYSRAI